MKYFIVAFFLFGILPSLSYAIPIFPGLTPEEAEIYDNLRQDTNVIYDPPANVEGRKQLNSLQAKIDAARAEARLQAGTTTNTAKPLSNAEQDELRKLASNVSKTPAEQKRFDELMKRLGAPTPQQNGNPSSQNANQTEKAQKTTTPPHIKKAIKEALEINVNPDKIMPKDKFPKRLSPDAPHPRAQAPSVKNSFPEATPRINPATKSIIARAAGPLAVAEFFSPLLRPTFEFVGLLDAPRSSAEIKDHMARVQKKIDVLIEERETRYFFTRETELRKAIQDLKDLKIQYEETKKRENDWHRRNMPDPRMEGGWSPVS